MSESTFVDAPANAGDEPDISCNRCGTLTTWNPYCPSCGAYLEFGGTPPWHPHERLSVPPLVAPQPEGSTAAIADSTDAAASPNDGDTPASLSDADKSASSVTVVTGSVQEAEITLLFSGGVRETEHLATESVEGVTKSAEELETTVEGIVVGAVDGAVDDLEDHDESLAAWHHSQESGEEAGSHQHGHDGGIKPWWASWNDHSQYEEQALDQLPDVPAARVIAAGAPVTTESDAQGVVFSSRRVIPAPEISAPGAELPGMRDDAMQRTRAMGAEEIEADGEVCPRCTLRNPAGRQYCDWCGTPMPGVLLGPESDAYNPYGLSSTDEVVVPTGPQRSYALKMTLLIILLLALAWGIWFFFFGPKAEQTDTALKVIAQQITETIDPTSGVPAGVTDVDASSTLVGTSPLALKTVSSRDYWASEPMTLYGQGSSVTFTLADSYEIDRMIIYPGIQNKTFDVNALATPRVVTLDFGNGRTFQTDIEYVQSESYYEQVIEFPTLITNKVKITINEVWGPRYPDPEGSTVGEVAISSILFMQVPSNTTVDPLATASASPSASGSPSPSSSASESPGSPDADSSASASASPHTSSSSKSSSSPTSSSSSKPSSSPKPSASSTPSTSPTPS